MHRDPMGQTVHCKECGQLIKFIKNSNSKFVPVDPGRGYFIPDESFGKTVFVTLEGDVRKGRRSTDGLQGYILHKCESKTPKEG